MEFQLYRCRGEVPIVLGEEFSLRMRMGCRRARFWALKKLSVWRQEVVGNLLERVPC